MSVHWHLGYSNKTACGIMAYKTSVTDEYDMISGSRLECTPNPKKVTCKNCRRVMKL